MYDSSRRFTYISKEVKEKFESFTTNEEIINYMFEVGEKKNFGLSEEYRKIN